jgi:hypothetical protein
LAAKPSFVCNGSAFFRRDNQHIAGELKRVADGWGAASFHLILVSLEWYRYP